MELTRQMSRLSVVRLGAVPGRLSGLRSLHYSQRVSQEKKPDQEQGSLFGEISEIGEDFKKQQEQALRERRTRGAGGGKVSEKRASNPWKDPSTNEILQAPGTTAEQLLLTPLERRLLQLAKKGKPTPPHLAKYVLKLSERTKRDLEPSMAVESVRMKSSVKKVTPLLRMLRGLSLQEALIQCRFSQKITARSVYDMLHKALEDSKRLGMSNEGIYIDQIWSGKDGYDMKMPDIRARGRCGVITTPFIHVKAILKTPETLERKASDRARKLLRRKVTTQHPSITLHGKTAKSAYRW